MRKRSVLGVTIAAAAMSAFVHSSRLTGAEESGRIALSGQVRSIEDGPMEGVVVSAKQDGSTVTTSVVSDEQGRRICTARLTCLHRDTRPEGW